MLAEIMQDDRPRSGTCQGGRCFVVVNGDSVVLNDAEQYSHESDPCLQYSCSVRDSSVRGEYGVTTLMMYNL